MSKCIADLRTTQLQKEYLKHNGESVHHTSSKYTEPRKLSPLLPAAELKSIIKNVGLWGSEPASEDIQRPPSALHAGDFTEDLASARDTQEGSALLNRSSFRSTLSGPLGTSPIAPWYRPPPSLGNWQSISQFSPNEDRHVSPERRSLRDREPSLSSYSSSSYVLKAPTTPLVQQSNNTDLDFSPRERSISPDKGNRRHTLPPHALHNWRSGPSSQVPVSSHPIRHSASYRREGSFPYGHHPRRSLTSSWSLQPSTSPPTPAFLRSRRTSVSSEASPLQHASLVGSYEESILRGWMSTAPSRPLDFTAQIGVLGKGDYKPKCPAHATLPFPAVFYNWATGNGRNSINDEPSPYVGHIDLQHSLSPPKSRNISRGVPTTQESNSEHDLQAIERVPGASAVPSIRPTARQSRKARRISPSRMPPGGSYRIPQQGQLQIIIKNPNKTAVKLFLVPYDLTDMEAGTKTFVRQRCYSADIALDSPLAAKPVPIPGSSTAPAKKSTLRYLIHVNICSPSKGRFYLYQNIRVVFANRVPDNKERLQTEIQVPEPKYSTWKLTKDSLSTSTAGARLTAEKASQRRTSGFSFPDDPIDSYPIQTFTSSSTFPFNRATAPPVPGIPFNLPPPVHLQRQKAKAADDDAMDIDTSRPTTASNPTSPLGDRTNRAVQLSSSYKSSSSQGSDGYGKLCKGDEGYGGLFGRPDTPEPGEGLLARSLRGLGVRRDEWGEGGEEL